VIAPAARLIKALSVFFAIAILALYGLAIYFVRARSSAVSTASSSARLTASASACWRRFSNHDRMLMRPV
jgi:hypothetical protein